MKAWIPAAGLVLLCALPARAQQPVTLTFAEALERARSSAPSVVAGRLRIDEARARLIGASRPLSSNPLLELEAGEREGDVPADYSVGLEQQLELPASRRARLDAVRASVLFAQQRALEIERATVREAGRSFVAGLAARERQEAAAAAVELASEALSIAERRYAAGDVAQLDVNLARTALARAAAEQRASEAELAAAKTELRILLDEPAPIELAGSLRDALSAPSDDVAINVTRPEMGMLEAEIAGAEADLRLGSSMRRPDFGLRLAAGREEGDRIVTGGIGVTLPLFSRGQEEIALANARLDRLRAEQRALGRAIEAEIRGAVARRDLLRASATGYAESVIPLVEENEALALESYEVGEIGLAELLLVRRESLDARLALIQQLIEVRLAEVEVRVQTGVWQ